MKFGLIGKKLSYSKSKIIHETFFKNKKLNYSYDLIELEESNLHKFMTNDIFDYKGINVTIPYKKDVMQYLDEIDKKAMDLGSVNTIKNINGKLIGYNTDIDGFDLMMKKNNILFENKDICILGTGATANMIGYYSNSENCRSVKYISRNKTNNNLTYEDEFSGDIVINTTPLGTDGSNDTSAIEEDVVKKFNNIIDINYNPYRTKILRYGIYNNKKIVSGFYMLVAQAIKAQSIWNDIAISNEIDTIYNEFEKSRNIVLIGMPGSGKSTISEILRDKLNRNLVQLDSYIEEKNNMKISDMFKISEDFFRKKENEAIENVCILQNHILDTGGGTILNSDNMDLLFKNGIIIFIDRELEDIISTIDFKTRPLLKDNYINNLKKLYNSRIGLYKKYAEYTIKNVDLDKTVNDIISIAGGAE